MNSSEFIHQDFSPDAMGIAESAKNGIFERATVSNILSATLIATYVAWWIVSIVQRRKLPPGPPRLPVIGE